MQAVLNTSCEKGIARSELKKRVSSFCQKSCRICRSKKKSILLDITRPIQIISHLQRYYFRVIKFQVEEGGGVEKRNKHIFEWNKI